MTPKEYALLCCLTQNKNLVMSREQLLVKCWGYDYDGDDYGPSCSCNELDAMGLIKWDVRFDHTDEAAPGQELVTIYAKNPTMSTYEPGGPIRYHGEEYMDLLLLLSTEERLYCRLCHGAKRVPPAPEQYQKEPDLPPAGDRRRNCVRLDAPSRFTSGKSPEMEGIPRACRIL